MKIYVAHWGYDYDAYSGIVGVFSSRELAEKALEQIETGDWKQVDEMKLDEVNNN